MSSGESEINILRNNTSIRPFHPECVGWNPCEQEGTIQIIQPSIL